jgi:hypothetical protein
MCVTWFIGIRLGSVEIDLFGGHVWKEITLMNKKRNSNERKRKSKCFRGKLWLLILFVRKFTYRNMTAKPHKRILYICFYKLYVLWHTDQFLGNDREINNETTATARQQVCKYATILEPLLGSDPRATIKLLLEAMFSVWSASRLHHSTDRVEFS